MTWLPISLKNAAKCDNWYQLQNHSITESLNAKGAREDPFIRAIACMLYLSVDPQYYFSLLMLVEKKWNRVFLLMSMLFSESLKKALVPLTHSKQIEVSPRTVCMVFHDLLWKIEKAKVNSFNALLYWIQSFTDLSIAGLPAELKHITQRRKRKQPWFPQSAASEEGPNSLPNRALQSVELWQRCDVAWCRPGEIQAQSKPIAEHNPSCEYWAIEGVSPLSQKPCISLSFRKESSTAWECSVKWQVCVCQG